MRHQTATCSNAPLAAIISCVFLSLSMSSQYQNMTGFVTKQIQRWAAAKPTSSYQPPSLQLSFRCCAQRLVLSTVFLEAV
ncbi:hypothetical protein IWW34DRAFT_717704 [Fusarium oxysporum f. sp. albedinis]|nr:hypothetical protein IWW34DRAFT_717704 [Fusarium oxysporum f. sp. albedinis]